VIGDHIRLEPARYAITGMSCGSQIDLRSGYGHDDMQPLDAPEYFARGSVLATNQKIAGRVFASTSDPMPARMYGGGL
jgi:hypothetical protein